MLRVYDLKKALRLTVSLLFKNSHLYRPQNSEHEPLLIPWVFTFEAWATPVGNPSPWHYPRSTEQRRHKQSSRSDGRACFISRHLLHLDHSSVCPLSTVPPFVELRPQWREAEVSWRRGRTVSERSSRWGEKGRRGHNSCHYLCVQKSITQQTQQR